MCTSGLAWLDLHIIAVVIFIASLHSTSLRLAPQMPCIALVNDNGDNGDFDGDGESLMVIVLVVVILCHYYTPTARSCHWV